METTITHKNIFILCTGRCGSKTFIMACKHIMNFSSAHESRRDMLGEGRLDYPKNHIEADNRLSWFLGRLDSHYGNNAIYVHLKRDSKATAISYSKRLFSNGIMSAYKKGIFMTLPESISNLSIALDLCNTVNSNIELFLKDKDKKMEFNIENAKEDFLRFWELIGAEGDIEAAFLEFETCYNCTRIEEYKPPPLLLRIFRKLIRLVVKLPVFMKNA